MAAGNDPLAGAAGVPVALILARADNGVIGVAGGLPWHLSGDLKFFKAQTLGKPVVMGRKTYQSIGKPLPGRPNLVITRDRSFHAQGVEVFRDVAGALARAQALAAESGAAEVMVSAGAATTTLPMSAARASPITPSWCWSAARADAAPAIALALSPGADAEQREQRDK